MNDRELSDAISPDLVQLEIRGVAGLSRRELMKKASVLGMAMAVPLGLLERAEAQSAAPANEPLQSFTPAETATLRAIIQRIIPNDESGPGAIEAGVPRYIDRLLRSDQNTRYGPNNPHQTLTEAYAAGLKAIDAHAQATNGASFASLSPEKQDAILHALDHHDAGPIIHTSQSGDREESSATGVTPSARQFFALIREHTMDGMFCDPYYGGNINFVGWDLTGYPGTKLMFTPAEQSFGGKIIRVHKGFMDYPIFASSDKGM
jgi:gluconate 2-dehydrogenase gamma chain